MSSMPRKARPNSTVSQADRDRIEAQSRRTLRALLEGWCTNAQLQVDPETGVMVLGNHTARLSEFRDAGYIVLAELVRGAVWRYRIPVGQVVPGHYYVYLVGDDDVPYTSPRYETIGERDEAVAAFFATTVLRPRAKYCKVHVFGKGRGLLAQKRTWCVKESANAKVA